MPLRAAALLPARHWQRARRSAGYAGRDSYIRRCSFMCFWYVHVHSRHHLDSTRIAITGDRGGEQKIDKKQSPTHETRPTPQFGTFNATSFSGVLPCRSPFASEPAAMDRIPRRPTPNPVGTTTHWPREKSSPNALLYSERVLSEPRLSGWRASSSSCSPCPPIPLHHLAPFCPSFELYPHLPRRRPKTSRRIRDTPPGQASYLNDIIHYPCPNDGSV